MLGECLAAEEAGPIFRIVSGMFIALIFFHGSILRKLSISTACILLLCCGISITRYQYEKNRYDRIEDRAEEIAASGLTGRVLSAESDGENRSLILGDCMSETTALGKVRCYLDRGIEEQIIPGQRIRVYGKIRLPEQSRNDGQFDSRIYYRGTGVSVLIYAKQIVLQEEDSLPILALPGKLRAYLEAVYDAVGTEEDAGVFKAMLLGDKQAIAPEIRELYQMGGIAHLLAVSGLHLSIIGMGFFRMLRKIGLDASSAGISAGAIILGYGVLTGSPGSAMRAVIMLMLHFLSYAVGRTYDTLSALSAAAILLLAAEPYSLFTSGFQMSFTAVAALAVSAECIPEEAGELYRNGASLIFLQLMSLPVVLYYYFEVPVYGIFLNLVLVPLTAYVVISGILTGILAPFSLKAAAVSYGGGRALLKLFLSGCMMTRELPGASLLLGRPASLQILLYYLGWTGIVVRLSGKQKNRMKKKIGWLLLWVIVSFILLTTHLRAPLEICCMDVGQGDGFLISSDGAVLMIDGGSSSSQKIGREVIVPDIKAHGIRRVNVMLFTHQDADHTNGALYILEEDTGIEVDNVCLPISAEKDDRYNRIKQAAGKRGIGISYLKSGDRLQLGGCDLKVFYPVEGGYQEDSNRHSVGAVLEKGCFKMLFTGDMDKAAEEELISEMSVYGCDPDVDILKCAHHGSETGTGEAFLEQTAPEYAVISYGRGNRYGHPHEKTVGTLSEHNIEMLETGKNGQIRIIVDTDGRKYRINKKIPMAG